MANDDYSQSGRRRPGSSSGLSVVRISELPATTPPAPAPFAAPIRPAMPAPPPVLTSSVTSSTTPAVPPPPPLSGPLSFVDTPQPTPALRPSMPAMPAMPAGGSSPSAPRRATAITGGVPRLIGSLDSEVEPSNPRSRPPTLAPAPPTAAARAADVNAALSALGIADAPPPPPPPPTTVTQQSVAARALQVLSASVLVGAAAFAAFTFRDGPAAWTQEQRRQLTDVWLRTNTWGRVRSDEVVTTVNAIGATVVPAAARADTRFVVVEGAVPRAEALPDGTIVVTTAALRLLTTDAELAAVLAHAVAHHLRGERTTRLDDSEHARSAQRALASSNPHLAAPTMDELVAVGDSIDESVIVAATQQLLEAGGWRAHALAEAVTKLQAQRAFHVPVSPALAHTLEQMPTSGRSDAAQYRRDVLDRIGHQR